MNAIKNDRRYCPCCRILTKCEANTMVWGGGDFLLVLATLGAWVVVRFLWDALANPWRCATCGSQS